eukprot:scaffold374238_cov47-Prasinocladus_malaysianus.AAC.1
MEYDRKVGLGPKGADAPEPNPNNPPQIMRFGSVTFEDVGESLGLMATDTPLNRPLWTMKLFGLAT